METSVYTNCISKMVPSTNFKTYIASLSIGLKKLLCFTSLFIMYFEGLSYIAYFWNIIRPRTTCPILLTFSSIEVYWTVTNIEIVNNYVPTFNFPSNLIGSISFNICAASMTSYTLRLLSGSRFGVFFYRNYSIDAK